MPHQKLFDLFETLGIEFKNFEHQPAYTFDEMYEFTNKIPGAHNKNLLLHSPLRGLVMIVMLGHDKLDLKACYETLEIAKSSFAKPEIMEEVLGITPGSVTPFALVNDKDHKIEVFLDEDMMSRDLLNYHPLRNDMTTTIKSKDLIKFLKHTGHQYKVVKLPKK